MKKTVLFSLLLVGNCSIPLIPVCAQTPLVLTLDSACQLALTHNKNMAVVRQKETIAQDALQLALEDKQPDIDLHAGYARLTNLAEYKNGLNHKVTTHTIPDMADIGGRVSASLYQGGRLQKAIQLDRQTLALTRLGTEKTANDLQLEVTLVYLELYRLLAMEQLLEAHVAEEKKRVGEAKAMRKEGVITSNEVLRVELQLTNLELLQSSTAKKTEQAYYHLKRLVQYPQQQSLQIDTSDLVPLQYELLPFETYARWSDQKDELRIERQKQVLAGTHRDLQKTNYFPSITGYASYGFNYPNYMFFPPNPNWYTLGKLGIDISWRLSSLYKNKTRVHLAEQQITLAQLETEEKKEQLDDELHRLYIQHLDQQEQLQTTRLAEQLAQDNYRIVATKYKNQLALATELVDADDALLQAKYNRLAVRIDLAVTHYLLIRAAGQLNNNRPR